MIFRVTRALAIELAEPLQIVELAAPKEGEAADGLFAVTVCGALSLLTHFIVLLTPTTTVTGLGE